MPVVVHTTVRIVQDVSVLHRSDREPASTTLRAGWLIGNVEGHTRGVEVIKHEDGTATLTLRADFVDTWARVPLSALELGPVQE